MKKALVFISAFLLVLVAGVAVAFMTTPSGDAAGDLAIEEPKETSTTTHEEEKPAGEEPVDEKVEETKEEKPADDEPPKDEPAQEDKPPADEPAKEEPPKEEPPKEEADTVPPGLVITYPENGQRFTEKEIAFEGETEPGSRVFAGEYEADVNDNGAWRIVLVLGDGGNLATFKAIDEAGNKSTASVKVYYDPPDETEKPDEPKSYEFWAEQKFGSCAEDPPYDKWYGMGEPGTKIWITSEYGSGHTVIGEHGEWWLKVFFEGAPCGQAFLVTLTTDAGHEKHYEFVRFCETPDHDK